jgi:hypothetical protein
MNCMNCMNGGTLGCRWWVVTLKVRMERVCLVRLNRRRSVAVDLRALQAGISPSARVYW